ncbi:unknown protein (plasmid) [Calothrix sp. PCC 7716]|nr:unknown protein [Calothrix sp. PCC 7716]
MHQEGEAIRNGVLQTTFFMRRHLESPVPSSTENQHKLDKHYLESIEKFHNSVKELSDYLYPAYIDESLPLAIQHLLDTWKNRSGLKLEYELPTEWSDEACERIHLFLMLLEEFLRIYVLEVTNNPSVYVKLKQQKTLSELMIQFTYSEESKLNDIKTVDDIFHLYRTIEILLSAKCYHHRRHKTETWYLRW